MAGQPLLGAGPGITTPIIAPREIAGKARADLHGYGADWRGPQPCFADSKTHGPVGGETTRACLPRWDCALD